MPLQLHTNGSTSEQIRCQICAHYGDDQLVPRSLLLSHIHEHIHYQPMNGRNERLERMCQEEYKDYIVSDFRQRLDELSNGSGGKRRRRQADISTFAVSALRLASFDPSLGPLSSSNALPSFPASSFVNDANALPSLCSSSTSSTIVNNVPIEEAIGPRGSKGIKVEEVSAVTLSEVKMSGNPTTNNNDEEAARFFCSMQQMEVGEGENETDIRQQHTESAQANGAKGTERAQRKGTTEKEQTETPPGRKRRTCSTLRQKDNSGTNKKQLPSSLNGTVEKVGRQSQAKATNKGTPPAKAQPTHGQRKQPNDSKNKCGICVKPVSRTFVRCTKCKRRFHGSCVKTKPKNIKRIMYWHCQKCQNEEEDVAEKESDDDIQQMYCTCNKPDNNEQYVRCDGCNEWFHPKCVGTTQKRIEALANAPFLCKTCQQRPQEWFESKMRCAAKTEPEN